MIERESNYYRDKFKILTHWIGIDEKEAERIGEPVIHNGLMTSYFVKDGYDYYTSYSRVSRGNYKNALRIAGVIAHLNPDSKIEDLIIYMNCLCAEKFDDGENKVDRATMIKYMTNVRDGLYVISPEVRKFFWVGIYKKIGVDDTMINDVLYSGKRSIVMSYINKEKYNNTLIKVLDAVCYLTEFGNKSGSFISMKDISELTNMHINTIQRLAPFFKDAVHDYNLRMFDVNSYSEFVKHCSVNKITNAIRRFIEELEIKLTQKKVAFKSGLHFNTVCSLWSEEDVQEAIEEYNKWLINYKLNK